MDNQGRSSRGGDMLKGLDHIKYCSPSSASSLFSLLGHSAATPCRVLSGLCGLRALTSPFLCAAVPGYSGQQPQDSEPGTLLTAATRISNPLSLSYVAKRHVTRATPSSNPGDSCWCGTCEECPGWRSLRVLTALQRAKACGLR